MLSIEKIRHARYLYIKRNVEKVWGARYTLGARYLSKNTVFCVWIRLISRSRWPRGLKDVVCSRWSAGIVDPNPTGDVDVCLLCECCLLSGGSLCDELITRPEESYPL